MNDALSPSKGRFLVAVITIGLTGILAGLFLTARYPSPLGSSRIQWPSLSGSGR